MACTNIGTQILLFRRVGNLAKKLDDDKKKLAHQYNLKCYGFFLLYSADVG